MYTISEMCVKIRNINIVKNKFFNRNLFGLGGNLYKAASSIAQIRRLRRSISIKMIRLMTIADYDEVYSLWMSIKGFGIRSVDDSREGVEAFLKRNPLTSVVDIEDGKIVGAILCGHDGRRGCLYHVCVAQEYRMRGIGKAMVVFCMNALKKEHINKVSLIAFTQNDIGNAFWNQIGWTKREDLNYYDFVLNTENITAFNK